MEQVVTDQGETVQVPAPTRDQLRASEIVLDHGIGKPVQQLDVTSNEETLASPLSTKDLRALIQALKDRDDQNVGERT